jgi:translocation and assembly module TamA
LRYYTPVGPVRFDIATPLQRRSADSVVQIYISIGQAF